MSAAFHELLRRAANHDRESIAGYLERRARAFELDAAHLLHGGERPQAEYQTVVPECQRQGRIDLARAVAAELRHAAREVR